MAEPGLRRTHVEALAHVVFGHLGILPARIGGIILLEIFRCRLIVSHAILRHRIHVEALLRILGAFHHRHEFPKQGGCAGVLAGGKALFGIFVFVWVIVRFVHLIELMRTTRQQDSHKQGCKRYFFHIRIFTLWLAKLRINL